MIKNLSALIISMEDRIQPIIDSAILHRVNRFSENVLEDMYVKSMKKKRPSSGYNILI
jgi:hypothetical protein